MPIKTLNGVAIANVKTFNGIARANWKTWNGISVPSVSPFNPADYGTVRSWFKANAIAGLVDNDLVASWVDSGPYAIAALQATSGLRPTYKTAVQNGLPVVRFATSKVMLSSTAFGTQPRTVVAVYQKTGTASTNVIGGGTSSASVYDVNNMAGIYAGSAAPGTVASSAWKVVVAYLNGSGSTIQTNANSPETISPGTTGFSNGYSLGAYNSTGTDALNGDIGELIVYDGSITSVAALVAALRSKWGI